MRARCLAQPALRLSSEGISSTRSVGFRHARARPQAAMPGSASTIASTHSGEIFRPEAMTSRLSFLLKPTGTRFDRQNAEVARSPSPVCALAPRLARIALHDRPPRRRPARRLQHIREPQPGALPAVPGFRHPGTIERHDRAAFGQAVAFMRRDAEIPCALERDPPQSRAPPTATKRRLSGASLAVGLELCDPTRQQLRHQNHRCRSPPRHFVRQIGRPTSSKTFCDRGRKMSSCSDQHRHADCADGFQHAAEAATPTNRSFSPDLHRLRSPTPSVLATPIVRGEIERLLAGRCFWRYRQ